jgi:ATP-dependent DNA ligase
MRSTFEFCISTTGTNVPIGPDWLHEVKYDDYRLRVERDDDRIRLITRGGYDWTKRYPWIVEAARRVRSSKEKEQVQPTKSQLRPRQPARRLSRLGPTRATAR